MTRLMIEILYLFIQATEGIRLLESIRDEAIFAALRLAGEI